jgi:hypothetical protein
LECASPLALLLHTQYHAVALFVGYALAQKKYYPSLSCFIVFYRVGFPSNPPFPADNATSTTHNRTLPALPVTFRVLRVLREKQFSSVARLRG